MQYYSSSVELINLGAGTAAFWRHPPPCNNDKNASVIFCLHVQYTTIG